MFKKFVMLLLLMLPVTGCSWNSYTDTSNVWCENYFTLTSDFNHRYSQPDYMLYIEKSYYQTFYDRTCHYYIKFAPGFNGGREIDVYGTYTMTLKKFTMSYEGMDPREPEFCLYHSPTIDFHIIDTLTISGQPYTEPFRIVYQAHYLYSARG